MMHSTALMSSSSVSPSVFSILAIARDCGVRDVVQLNFVISLRITFAAIPGLFGDGLFDGTDVPGCGRDAGFVVHSHLTAFVNIGIGIHDNVHIARSPFLLFYHLKTPQRYRFTKHELKRLVQP
jgi:hypothetical protein